jgi:hypothetical protein
VAELDAIGIVTGDLQGSLRFYGTLGVDVPRATAIMSRPHLPASCG